MWLLLLFLFLLLYFFLFFVKVMITVPLREHDDPFFLLYAHMVNLSYALKLFIHLIIKVIQACSDILKSLFMRYLMTAFISD